MAIDYLRRPGQPDLAYRLLPAGAEGKSLPALMFLGGFRSDMEGTKALYLEKCCRDRGQSYVRFDYRGHGRSGGDFRDGTIGLWTDDALTVLDTLTSGPVILAGSSMGGWIALLLARQRPARIRGIVGIAAAPDFTRWISDGLTPDQRQQMDMRGFVAQPSDYSPEPTIFTRALLEDGECHCLLDRRTALPMPIRLIQGMKDPDVPWQTAWRIKKAIDGDVEVTLVENGDHRLSRPEDLVRIDDAVVSLIPEKVAR